MKKYDCNTENIIYCIECKVPRCKHIQYIGKTSDPLKVRFGAHRSDVNSQKDKAISNHFNSPGHSISDMTITIVEKIYNKNPLFLREKEKFYMKLFNTRLGGLNTNSWANCYQKIFVFTFNFRVKIFWFFLVQKSFCICLTLF